MPFLKVQRYSNVNSSFSLLHCMWILITPYIFLQTSLQLGSKLLKGFGVMSDDVTFLSQLVRDSMELQAQEVVDKTDDQVSKVMKPLQVPINR